MYIQIKKKSIHQHSNDYNGLQSNIAINVLLMATAKIKFELED